MTKKTNKKKSQGNLANLKKHDNLSTATNFISTSTIEKKINSVSFQSDNQTSTADKKELITSSNSLSKRIFNSGTCSKENCQAPFGSCVDDKTCQCAKSYLNYPGNEAEVQSCTYNQKNQSVFFIIELLTVVGLGHIYAKRILYGAIKFSSICIILFVDCFFRKCLNKHEYKSRICFNNFVYILYFSILVWQTTDLIMIALNKFTDGNGIELHSWC
jgi:hypothetical protein